MDIYIQQGATFWTLSNLFQIPLQLIIDSNRNALPHKLSIGQRIKIPGFTTTNYTIRPGDTLWSIARSRNLDVAALYLVNPAINPNNLQIGQTIVVPVRVTWKIVDGRREYDYETMNDHLRGLQQIYPFMQINSIGTSVLGKQIPEVLVGAGMKKVHYNGSFHANEWITSAVLMEFLNDYLLALTNQTSLQGRAAYPLYTGATLSLVPMVNPDGVDLVLHGAPASPPWDTRVVELNKGSTDFSGWKANIRGVDLNNQFPAKWEIEKERKVQEPAPRDYPGDAPLTEPETIAMAQLTRNRDFDRVLAFHTQGQEIYWGFENLEPPESEIIAQEFERLSGYKAIRNLDSYAGYKDWFIQDFRRPGFTFELGLGVNPLPISQFDEIYNDTLGIMLAGLYL